MSTIWKRQILTKFETIRAGHRNLYDDNCYNIGNYFDNVKLGS